MVSIDACVQRELDGNNLLIVGSVEGKYGSLAGLSKGDKYGVHTLSSFREEADRVANGYQLVLKSVDNALRLYDGDIPTGLAVKIIHAKF